MTPTVQARDRLLPVTSAQPGPHMNSLTHGLRSGHVLLPGDNVAEFRKRRHRLFHAYQPRTLAEARCVETIAANDWRIARCRREQRFFRHHLGAAMDGHPDTTSSLSSPDLHRLHHRTTDCTLEERRYERSLLQAEATLALLQKERTRNLIPKLAAMLEPYEVFLEEGEPILDEEPTPDATGPEEQAATVSADGGNGKLNERTPGMPVARLSHAGNRARRRAARQPRRYS